MGFLELLKSYRKTLLLAFVFLIITNLLGLALPWGVKLILDEVFVSGKSFLLPWILGGLFAATLLRSFTNYGGYYFGMKLAEEAVMDLREKLYAHLLKLSVISIENASTGALISRLVGDLDSVKRFLQSGLSDFLYAILAAFFVTAVLLCIHWKLALVTLLFLPIFVATYWRLMGRLKAKYGDLRQGYAEVSAHLGEVFRGIRIVHLFSRQNYEARRFAQKQKEILRSASQTYAAEAAFWAATEFLSAVGALALLWFGSSRVISGEMTTGTLMAFYAYSGLLFLPLIRIASVNGPYQEACASMQRIRELLAQAPGPPEVSDAISFSSLQGAVEFQNVHFGYGKSRKVLEDINLKAEPGEIIALVGPSGCGKTTLVSLLVRFFDPQSGSILIDGRDLRRLQLSDYRRRVAMVFQNDFLFDDTIRQNVLYGNLNASQEALEQAAKIANIHDFIMSLPAQYQTRVGEGGIHLSSGERQRVAIARAVLRNPSILILDEATSAVDTDSEHLIAQALQKLMAGRTTFIISHRASALEVADKTIFVESGRIANHVAS